MTESTAGLARRAGIAGRESPVALRSSAGVALIAATVLASLIGFLDASVVNVAVPAIGTSLDASVATLQWTLTSYLLAVAALLLLSGALADRFGRRRVLAVGLLVMLVASVAVRGDAVGRRADRGASRPGRRRRAGRAQQPRAAQRYPAARRPGARHRDLGRAGDARDHRRPVRRRLAGRPRVMAGGIPAQPAADPGRLARAAVLPETGKERRPLSLDVVRRTAGGNRSRRGDLRADRRPGIGLAERAGAGRGGGRGCVAWRRWCPSSGVDARRCCDSRCLHPASSTRST